jgi:hypothetical protein
MKSRKYIVYIYVITPIVLLATFAIYFNRFQAEQRAKDAQAAIIAQNEADAKAKEQAELERKLDAEAKIVSAAKAKAVAEKEAKETAERRSKIDALRKSIDVTRADLNRYTQKNADQTAKVKAAHAERVKTEAEWMKRAKEMERERAVKSATDLEAQRLMGMVMDRFEGEWCKALTTPPPPAK